jgi:hypothetical protein
MRYPLVLGIASLVGLSALLPAVAYATIVRVDFSANVSDSGGLGASFPLGSTVTGYLTYDTSVSPRTGSTADSAVFDSGVGAFLNSFAVSEFVTGPSEVQIDNFIAPPTGLGLTDRLAIIARHGLNEDVAVADGKFAAFGIRLDDANNNAIADALTQPGSLSLSSFLNAQVFIFVTPNTGGLSVVSANINSLTSTAVIPEPAGLAILVPAIATLRRRR